MTTREMLQAHTIDQIRPGYPNGMDALDHLTVAAHASEVTDEQAEAAALAFVLDWSGHPVYRKTARYGVILHTLRHRPELSELVEAFSAVVDKVGNTSGGIEGWYADYTGGGR